MITVIRYRPAEGEEPIVTTWIKGLKDRRASLKIEARITRIEQGNFGDHKAVGEGVSELRITEGAGYRVYYGKHGDSVVVLLCGGDKDSQDADVKEAKRLWTAWKKQQAKAK